MQERSDSRERDGRAGAANTPPFGAQPRAVETAANHQIASQSGESAGSRDEAERPLDQAADVPPYGGIAAGAPGETDRRSGADASTHDDSDEQGETAYRWEGRSDSGGGAGARAKDPISEGMIRAAERLEDAADRIEAALGGASQEGGARARAGEMAGSLTDTMDSVARYLRANDARDLRADVESRVRERPLQTLLAGLAAGWIAGKILR